MTRNHFIPVVFSLLLAVAGTRAQTIIDNRILASAAMQEDFRYLRKILEETHPGLYRHQHREVIQHTMDSLYATLDRPMGFYQFYRVMAYLVAEVKCEHTSCSLYANKLFGEIILAGVARWA